jgi:anti-sigma-K factor RskA
MKVDVKEYIASGILEAYALGHVTDHERTEVEAVAAEYPEIRKELDAIQDSLNAYAKEHSIAPTAGTKEKVLQAISEYESDKRPVRRLNSMEDEERSDPRNKAVWSLVASVLLIISLTGNLYTFKRMNNAESYVHELEHKVHRKDSTINATAAKTDQMEKDLAILKDPMYKMVELKGQAKDTTAKAMVCFCPGSKLVYFAAEKMPEPPKGMQYQLWAIVDGKPVDEGMITMGEGLHKMKDLSTATAFAVTLEKEGGSDVPHGDMIVMGNI